jgi:hypothetical protein
MTETSTEHARRFFADQGFQVSDIPTAEILGEKRADLRAIYGDEEYIVEAKYRNQDYRWSQLLHSADESGCATASRSIETWRTLGKVVKNARDQLIATPASPNAFRILWVVALHPDDSFVIECFQRQLMGTRQVFVYDTESLRTNLSTAPRAMLCYYFDDNDFERYSEIDAAMLCTAEGGRLFVNNYSPNRQRFLDSHLAKLANHFNGLTDAVTLAQSGVALLIDSDLRGAREGGSQQSYLRDKYDVLVSVASESQFVGIAFAQTAAGTIPEVAGAKSGDVETRPGEKCAPPTDEDGGV